MTMFANDGNRVLFVEPVISPIPKKRNPEFYPQTTTHAVMTYAEERLFVLTPPFGLPFSRNPVFCRINQSLQYNCIVKWKRNLGFHDPILWVYEPRSAYFLNRLETKLLVYDCVDEHPLYPGVNQEEIEKLEKSLLRSADIVFVTAKNLLESKKRYNSNVFFVSNGVDVKAYSESRTDEHEPLEISGIPSPRLGFVGGIHDWIDLDLVQYIARANPNWALVLIGPIGHDADISRVKALKNVHFLGYKPLETIPKYITAFDVCLSIFTVNEMTRRVNPLKVYEYLAAGKPVVSVNLPEVQSLEDVVYIGNSYPDFVGKIAMAMREDSPETRARRIRRISEYSWDNLFRLVSKYVERQLILLSRRDARSQSSIGHK